MMKLKYLGTAAAERVPAIFCACELCAYARKNGGKDVRTQSQAWLDDGALMLDFPADSYLHLLKYGLNFNDLEHLLITHWHSDHFYGEDLAFRMSNYGNQLTNCLTIYGSAEVKKFFDRAFELEGLREEERVRFVTLAAFQTYQIGPYQVQALPAEHGLRAEDCLIYVISRGGKSLLYAHDTGFPSARVLDYLADGLKLDFVSLDCTGQNLPDSGEIHMNLGDNVRLMAELKRRGICDAQTLMVANHFSHNGGLNHEQMCSLARQVGLVTAYDGLEIEF